MISLYNFYTRDNCNLISDILSSYLPEIEYQFLVLATDTVQGEFIKSNKFYFKSSGCFFNLSITTEDEIIIFSSEFCPPTGKFHHHINVHKSKFEKTIKEELLLTIRDSKIDEILNK